MPRLEPETAVAGATSTHRGSAASRALPPPYDELHRRLATSIAPARLVTDPLRLLAWGTDASFYRLVPKLVVVVEREDELVRVLAECAALATQEAEKILSAIAEKAEAGGLECTTMHTIAPAPWEAILNAAKKAKADAIVMASHGRRGVSALLLGSETQKVLTHSKIPVIVVR
jgi:nucleotide-binding universal stress UspA family protein